MQVRGDKLFLAWPPSAAEELGPLDYDPSSGFAWSNTFDPADEAHCARGASSAAYSVLLQEGQTLVLPSGWFHWAKASSSSITLMRNFCDDSNYETSQRLMLRFEQSTRWQRDVRLAVQDAREVAERSSVCLDSVGLYRDPKQGIPPIEVAHVRQLVHASTFLYNFLENSPIGETELGLEPGQVCSWLFSGAYLLLWYHILDFEEGRDIELEGSTADYRLFSETIRRGVIDRFQEKSLLAQRHAEHLPQVNSQFMRALATAKTIRSSITK